MAPPFAAFRKAHGSAYCFWKLGDRARAIACAREAVSHAGDGGYVRFRVLALDLLAHLVTPAERAAVRARAERLARSLQDEELLQRFE